MKKIISILAALVLLITSFQAVLADTAVTAVASAVDPTLLYSDTIALEDEADISSSSTYTITSGLKAYTSLSVADGAITVSKKANDSGAYSAAQLVTKFGKDFSDDKYVFGFDIEINGATTTSYNEYNGYAVIALIPGLTNAVINDYGTTTSSCFYVSSATAAQKPYITAKRNADNTDFVYDTDGTSLVLACGEATIYQGKPYTIKVYVDDAADTYEVYVVDEEGNSQRATSGSKQNAFSGIGKLETTIESAANNETTYTIDNYFVNSNVPGIFANSKLSVTSDSKIAFSAMIPESWSAPKLYINDTLVGNITTIAGTSVYDITAMLPEGTAFGNADIEIKATENTLPVSAEATVVLTKEITTTLVENVLALNNTYNPLTDQNRGGGRNYTLSQKYTNGLFEIVMDIKTTEGLHLGYRINSDSTSYGALFKGSASTWNTWVPATLNSKGTLISDGETVNKIVLRMDYTANAISNNCPFSLLVNGTVVDEGTFILSSGSTVNGIGVICINPYGPGTNGTGITYTVSNVTLSQIGGLPAAEEIKASYAGGAEVVYDDEPLSTYNLNAVTFTLDSEIGNTEGNVSFVDESGAAVEGATISANGKALNVALTSSTLESGVYKLIVGKNATAGGNALGAALEYPVELTSEAAIISPAKNEIYTGSVKLSAFDPEADKVVFKINDEKVYESTEVSATGVYSSNYTATTSGVKYFDVYSYNGNDVSLYSITFTIAEEGKSNYEYNDFDSKSLTTSIGGSNTWASMGGGSTEWVEGKDGGFALKFMTKGANMKWFHAAYKVLVTEYDINFSANANISHELGYNINGQTSDASADGYKTVFMKGSGGDYGYVFSAGASGTTFYGSDTLLTPGNWYHVKHVIDIPNKMQYCYLGDNLVYQEELTDANIKTSYETGAMYTKYRMLITSSDGNDAYFIMDNFKRYTPLEMPAVASVTAGGAAIENNVIAQGTDAVVVSLDASYDALTADLISVKADGESVGVVSVTNNASFTVSGLSGTKAGSQIVITVSGATYSTVLASDLVIPVFVGNADKICVLPLNIEQLADGSSAGVRAYSKYINGSNTDLNTYLIIAEYEDNTQIRIKKAEFSPVAMEANGAGLVSAYLSGVTSAQNCKVMLWSTALSPIQAPIGVSGN